MAKTLRYLQVIFLLFLSVATLAACQKTSEKNAKGIYIYPKNQNTAKPHAFYNEVSPGGYYIEKIIIGNNSESNQKITLKALDGKFDEINSTSSFALEQEKQNEFGAWAKFSKNSFILKPSQRKTITMKVIIPENTPQKSMVGGIQYNSFEIENNLMKPLENLLQRIGIKKTNISEEKPKEIKQTIRTIKTVSFKVTDSPEKQEKLQKINLFFNHPFGSSQLYFYFSSFLFIIGIIIYFTLFNKKT